MTKKIIFVLVLVPSLWASEILSLTSAGNNIVDGSVYISPYGGTLSTSTASTKVQLFCDDYNNESYLNTSWSVNVTTVNGDLSTTRFYASNPAGGTNPVGRQLYEEEAWLFTQLLNTASADTKKAIQEAAWHLTSVSASQPATHDYIDWMKAAANDYNQIVAGYVTPDYSQWYVTTQVGYAGNTTSQGNQELFAQYVSGVTIQTTTPEPATFVLLGTALILIGGARKFARFRER